MILIIIINITITLAQQAFSKLFFVTMTAIIYNINIHSFKVVMKATVSLLIIPPFNFFGDGLTFPLVNLLQLAQLDIGYMHDSLRPLCLRCKAHVPAV